MQSDSMHKLKVKIVDTQLKEITRDYNYICFIVGMADETMPLKKNIITSWLKRLGEEQSSEKYTIYMYLSNITTSR